MMRHYEELAKYEREGFDIVVDKTWEDIDPRSQFDLPDIEEILMKIDEGTYDWFMLRVRVFFDAHEMGSHYLGGCLYEDARDVLTDGTAEDCISAAMDEAKQEIVRLREKLADLVV
jgi:hypothetical protein